MYAVKNGMDLFIHTEHSLKRLSMCGYETVVSEKSGKLAEKADSWVLGFCYSWLELMAGI